jgi:DNA replication protein DnaC
MIGKTHLATALGYAACQHGYRVLFANAIDVINTLSAAQTKGALKSELKRYLSPELLLLDEIGYLPSTSAEPTCYSRSSANATNAVLSYLPPTKPSNNGLPSSTVIARLPPPCSTVSSTTLKPF